MDSSPNAYSKKTALITGASRGLGLALAFALARRGWDLIIDARGGAELDEARSELSKFSHVTAIQGDISDLPHRRSLAQAARKAGGLHLIINNASTVGPSPMPKLLEYPLSAMEVVYRVNVLAPLGLIQEVKDLLQPNATIINVTSDAGVTAYPGWGGYGSSKAALEHLTAILAAENPGWRIYMIDPGDMRTQMHQEAAPDEDISDLPLPDESVPGFLLLIEGKLPGGRYQVQQLVTLSLE